MGIKSHIPLGSLANHQTPPVSHHSDHDLSFSLAMGPSGIRGGPNDLIFDASFIGAANNAEKALLSPVPVYSKQRGRCLQFIFVIEEKGILAFLPTYSSYAQLQKNSSHVQHSIPPVLGVTASKNTAQARVPGVGNLPILHAIVHTPTHHSHCMTSGR